MPEILIGKIAVTRGLISQRDLDRATEIQAATSPRKHLGEILVQEGLLTQKQVDMILAQQDAALETKDLLLPRKRGEALFGRIAIGMGFTTEAILNDALRRQAEAEDGGSYRQLGEILVEIGAMTPDQLRRVLEKQERSIRWCPNCETVFNVALVSKRVARCPDCGRVLEEAHSDQIAAEVQIAFTSEGMRVSSLAPTPDHPDNETTPRGTIISKKVVCPGCGGNYVVLLQRGAKSAICPGCRTAIPL